MRDEIADRKTALYEDLRRAILTLERPPGAPLDEVRLGAEYGVSRTPMREVLRRLAAEGLATIHANRGARVSDMGHTTLRDFFVAAPMIYAAILRLAALNATPAQVGELKAAQRDFAAALAEGEAAERTLANTRFHEITGEMAGNVYLRPSFERLLVDHARIGMTFYRPRDARLAEGLARASAQHEAIIAAIEAGDEARAAGLAAEHWELSRHQIERFAMPAPLDGGLGAPPGGDGR